MKRQKISGTSPFEPIIGFSRAVRVSNVVHLSGTGPVGVDDLDPAGQTRRRAQTDAVSALEQTCGSLPYSDAFRCEAPGQSNYVARLISHKCR
ncbi:MAG: hypothetical protein ABSC48_15810 [Terracidiphilus sp.]